VYIEPYADLALAVGFINVIVDIRCTGGRGDVVVNLSQTAQQSANGVGGSFAEGFSAANCDGTWRRLSVGVVAPDFNLGCAHASAVLTSLTGRDTDDRTIQITD
jgi:hypothetical protein